MPKSTSADHHQEEEHEVVAGVDQRARGQGMGFEAYCAQDQADRDEQHKRSNRMALLFGMDQREGQAGGDGGGDHCEDGPLRLAVRVERKPGFAGAAFDCPIPGGGEGGQQKAEKNNFFKEGRKSYTEGEHEPRCAWSSKDIFDGRVGRAGQQQFVERGEHETGDGDSRQMPAKLKSSIAAPMDAGKKILVPEERKDEKAASEHYQIDDRFAAQNVMNIGGGRGHIFCAKEVNMHGGQHQQRCAYESQGSKCAQQEEMTEMRNARGQWGFGLQEEVIEWLGCGIWDESFRGLKR